jgi:hypothetical protein
MAAIDFPNSPSVGTIFTAGNSSYRWTGAAWVSNNLVAITWADVSGKPSTFPPSSHTHAISDVTNLQTALDGKQAVVSGVSSTEIGYLDGVTSAIQTQLDGKAATSHTHVKANITDFAHVHPISEVTNLQTSLDGKAATVHTHAIADTTGLQTTLDGKAATSHTHSIANVTGLQTALDGKAATVHTHAISDITGLQTALDSEVNRVNGTVTTASTSLSVVRNITLSTSAPTGGADGDVWLVYTP